MTTTKPTIKVPAGMQLVETEPGCWEVLGNKEPMSKTVAFRLPASTYVEIMALVECFPDKGWGSAMRWLLSDPDVRARIARKVHEASSPRR